MQSALLESNGSDDEEQGAPSLRRPTAPRERQRKAARPRRPRSQPRALHATRAAKGESLTASAPPANCVPPAAVSQPCPQAATEPSSMVTPSATPSLKIRLPRFSLSAKSTPTSPVQARTGERPRRSLRRQTSTTGSSSTSISKGDGRGSAAESPRE